MKKLLICLSGGGHTTQALQLIEKLGNEYEYEYVVEKTDKLTINKLKKEGKIFYISRSREYNQNLILSIPSQIKSLIEALKIIIKSESKAVISFGASFSFYLCLFGKLTKKKVIFIESWSRTNTKSLSGKLNYPISDLFFVQWKKQKTNYPKSIYAGRLG